MRSWALGASAIVVVLGLTGCDAMFNVRSDGVVSEEAVTELRFSGGSGDVTVLRDETVKGIDIRRRARYADQSPSESIRISGGVAVLDSDCGHQCTASYEVRVPRPLRIRGETGSGDVDLRSGSDVGVHLGSGDVSIVDATGQVVVETGSGDITLDLPGTANVSARAGSGDIEVRIPDGTCRVSADTSSGDRTVRVSDGPAGSPELRLHTGSGDITVLPSLHLPPAPSAPPSAVPSAVPSVTPPGTPSP
jgi:hypothetical protein